MAIEDIEMNPVMSSNIAAAGYDEETKTLDIEFNSGATYRYSSVPKETAMMLWSAASPGRYFHDYIKNYYSVERLD